MARILVCDDAPDLRLLQRLALVAAGHQVAEAAGGRAALAALARGRRPDVVLLDLQMPDLDGWAVLDRLRASPAHAQVRVVVCSVKADRRDLARAWDHGCDGYLVKPFDLVQLVDAVEAVLQRPHDERGTWRADRLRHLAQPAHHEPAT